MPQPIKSHTKHPVLDADELLRTDRVQHWFQDNLRTIVTLVGILVLAGAAWAIVELIQQRAEQRAAVLYATAFATYQEAQAPERQLRLVSPETKELYERAINEFQAVRDQYPTSAHGSLALFMQANAMAAVERYPDAVSAYQAWLAGDARSDLRPLVIQRLAYALWASGDTAGALAQFDAITTLPGAPTRDLAYFEKGRIFEQLGQNDKALEAYTALAKSFGASPWASEGNARIVALGGTPPGAEVPPTLEGAKIPSEPAASPAPTATDDQPSQAK